MCKATDYSNSIKNLVLKANADLRVLSKELSRLDKAQQEILGM